jgi:hypothetical protein
MFVEAKLAQAAIFRIIARRFPNTVENSTFLLFCFAHCNDANAGKEFLLESRSKKIRPLCIFFLTSVIDVLYSMTPTVSGVSGDQLRTTEGR